MSPFKVKCHQCGQTIYEEQNNCPGIEYVTRRNCKEATPSTRFVPPITLFILNKIGSHCPKCHAKLNVKPIKVEVTILEKLKLK